MTRPTRPNICREILMCVGFRFNETCAAPATERVMIAGRSAGDYCEVHAQQQAVWMRDQHQQARRRYSILADLSFEAALKA